MFSFSIQYVPKDHRFGVGEILLAISAPSPASQVALGKLFTLSFSFVKLLTTPVSLGSSGDKERA